VTKQSLLDLIYTAHRLLAELESAPRDYGTGDFLYSSDIHTVMAISCRSGCNLTELASAMGVSKPAAFKFVRKMLGLGYLIKERPTGSEKEVSLFLSEKGKKATLAHEAFERKTFDPLRAIEADLAESERLVIGNFLRSLQEALVRDRS
jgi:DNA-binding MarR family transcriptional regulator